MKIIIAGSRSIEHASVVIDAIKASGFELTEIVSGTSQGVDRLGEAYADTHKITLKRFPADWNKHGKSAGYKRNQAMSRYADALIAVWDGESKGTKHMIDIATNDGLQVFIWNAKEKKGHHINCEVGKI